MYLLILVPGGRKSMQAIGPMKKSKLGYDDIDDDFGHGMYFNPSNFPLHRPEKESSLVGSIKCTLYMYNSIFTLTTTGCI
jgi:hypothetical protein